MPAAQKGFIMRILEGAAMIVALIGANALALGTILVH
jgi:hypothetical protein